MGWNEYKEEVKKALDLFDFNDEIVNVLVNSKKNNQKIFVAGNGGSAATAIHYVCDFSKGGNNDWKNNTNRFKAICLSDNIGYMTAIANDENYDEVFSQQLVNLAHKGDILVLISCSGNSPNIVKAVEYAKEVGVIVIGITGFSGGKLKELCDYSAHIQMDSYTVCEDIHHIFGHYLTNMLFKS
tara:strand:+ start:576 stop:1127 length:552 start_codon:yes stop_codon:yes gene_type:complete